MGRAACPPYNFGDIWNRIYCSASTSVGLTAEEQAEQKKLYKIYLGEIRQQFSATLDNVSVEEKDGTVVPFKQAYKKKK